MYLIHSIVSLWCVAVLEKYNHNKEIKQMHEFSAPRIVDTFARHVLFE